MENNTAATANTANTNFAFIPVTRTASKRHIPDIQAYFSSKDALVVAFSPEWCDKFEQEHQREFRGTSVVCYVSSLTKELCLAPAAKGTPGARVIAKRTSLEGAAQLTISGVNLPADILERWEGKRVCESFFDEETGNLHIALAGSFPSAA